MEALVKGFWSNLQGILQLQAVQLLTGHTDLKYRIGNSSNDYFLLRAYLTILRSNGGNELSIIVDIKNQKDGLLIESDIVSEEGGIITDGPSVKLHRDLSESLIHSKVDEWFKSFEHLFIEKSIDIEAAIKNLE